MGHSMFDELICPDCRTPLAVRTSGDTADGVFDVVHCVNCCLSYPVIKGIPRMIREMAEQTNAPRASAARLGRHAADFHKTWHRTQASFGRQWLRYDVQKTDEDKQTFENKTGFSLDRSFWDGDKGPEGPIATAWNLTSLPRTFIIDHTGVIRAYDLPPTFVETKIEQLVADAEKANVKE